jgi:thiol-disulfide isomerase/thioredoxin
MRTNKLFLLLVAVLYSGLISAQYNYGTLDFNYTTVNFQPNVDYSGTDSNANGWLDYDEITLEPGAPSGTNFHLFDELTNGKPILIDFYSPSCHWCRVWSSIIDSTYEAYGPNGTDQLNVVGVCSYTTSGLDGYKGIYYFWESTVFDTLHYPLMNHFPNNPNVADVTGDAGVFSTAPYNIVSWPQYVMVCPDRTWKFIEGWTAVTEGGGYYYGGGENLSDSILAAALGCDPIATETNDALIYSYISPTGLSCNENITPRVKLQSRGTSELTMVDIGEYVNGNLETTFHWTGSLNQYDDIDIDLNEITLVPGTNTVEFKIENTNGVTDENISNNIFTQTIELSSNPSFVNVVFDFDYVSNNDFAWEIREHDTQELIIEKSYDNSYAYSIDNQEVCLNNDKCYDFTFISIGGYGINASPSVESLIVLNENNEELIHFDETNAEGNGPTSGQFTKTETFCIGNTTNITNNTRSLIKIFPNPSNGVFVIQAEEIENIRVVNISGMVVYENNTSLHKQEINLSNQPKGIYFVKVNTASGLVVKKIIIE